MDKRKRETLTLLQHSMSEHKRALATEFSAGKNEVRILYSHCLAEARVHMPHSQDRKPEIMYLT